MNIMEKNFSENGGELESLCFRDKIAKHFLRETFRREV